MGSQVNADAVLMLCCHCRGCRVRCGVWRVSDADGCSDSELGKDLVKTSEKAVVMEFTFPPHFPFAPPFCACSLFAVLCL